MEERSRFTTSEASQDRHAEFFGTAAQLDKSRCDVSIVFSSHTFGLVKVNCLEAISPRLIHGRGLLRRRLQPEVNPVVFVGPHQYIVYS